MQLNLKHELNSCLEIFYREHRKDPLSFVNFWFIPQMCHFSNGIGQVFSYSHAICNKMFTDNSSQVPTSLLKKVIRMRGICYSALYFLIE